MKTFEGLRNRLKSRDPYAIAGLALLGMAWIAILSLALDAQQIPQSARLHLIADPRLWVGAVMTVAGAATLLWTRK